MPLVPVTEHQAAVAALLAAPPSEPELLPAAEALGRVLAEPVVAREQLPSFANSAMDGYAVRAADVAGASPDSPVRLPVGGDIPAGAPVGTLAPGVALRIMTGAPVPDGADAVVEVEATDGGTTTVEIREAREAGTFVRKAGSDVRAGDEVLPRGSVLGAAQVGILHALGVATVACVRRPRVLVLSTGSELAVDPEPGSGRIRDANGPMLAAAVLDAGAVAVPHLSTTDDVPTFLAALEAALPDVDLVLTSGGVSAGAYEVVKDALGPRGVSFTKVAMQPGMPQGIGTYDGVPVVCLPGNPVSSLVSFEVFVRPALRRRAGNPHPERPVVSATLTEPLTSPAGRRQLRRGRLDRAAGTVTPWGPAGSGFLGWYAGADCLVDVPADATDVSAGAVIDVWDLTVG
ncbi:MAG: molybdopterin molybdotransferase MoeA [Nocardioidaceae bacterium]|nr:molybdopterin molybdotransferase MoeA [Nocardioidaceae bacterium]MCL2613739.1 molybdopterin molybdotransferase MoeA [Nocardioidaceae bacterium]